MAVANLWPIVSIEPVYWCDPPTDPDSCHQRPALDPEVMSPFGLSIVQ